MNRAVFIFVSCIFVCVVQAKHLSITPTVFDDAAFSVVEPNADIEILADDIGWAEAPLWVAPLNALLFSDIEQNKVLKWSQSDGLTDYLYPSGHNPDGENAKWRGANGLIIDQNGYLVLAQQGGRTVARMNAPLNSPAPLYELLADTYQSKKLNSPNDVALHHNGTLFFTDPPYGLNGFENSPLVELSFFGVFALTPNGKLVVLDKSLEKPNGMTLSRDYRYLYVTDSQPGVHKIWRYELNMHADVVAKSLFFDAGGKWPELEGATDGLKEHHSGVIFATLPGGFGVLSSEGTLLAKYDIGFTCNLAFDVEQNYVYLTQPHRLLRMKLPNPLPK